MVYVHVWVRCVSVYIYVLYSYTQILEIVYILENCILQLKMGWFEGCIETKIFNCKLNK